MCQEKQESEQILQIFTKENENLQSENKNLKSTVSDVQQKLQKCQDEYRNISQEITKEKAKISDLSKVSFHTIFYCTNRVFFLYLSKN